MGRSKGGGGRMGRGDPRARRCEGMRERVVAAVCLPPNTSNQPTTKRKKKKKRIISHRIPPPASNQPLTLIKPNDYQHPPHCLSTDY